MCTVKEASGTARLELSLSSGTKINYQKEFVSFSSRLFFISTSIVVHLAFAINRTQVGHIDSTSRSKMRSVNENEMKVGMDGLNATNF